MTVTTQSPPSTWRARLATIALHTLATALPAQLRNAPTLPPGSEGLQVPAGNAVSFHTYAHGVQIYRFDATASQWVFVAPSALLFADAGCQAIVGVHCGGPTWTTNSGSTVTGQRIASSTVVHLWPLTLEVCRATRELDFDGDPADELIAATSLVHNVPPRTRAARMRRSKVIPLAGQA